MSKHHNNDLPAVTQYTAPLIRTLASHLNVESQDLTSEPDIQRVLEELPELLKLAAGKADASLLLRFVVSIAVGTLDSATNYGGNIAILALRKRFEVFRKRGMPLVLRDFVAPGKLQKMWDSDLFRFCRQFGFITDQGLSNLVESGQFRNKYSAAHPAVGKVNVNRFLSFVRSSWSAAMGEHSAKPTIDPSTVLKCIYSPSMSSEQLVDWFDKLSQVIETEGSTVFRILHGVYCEHANDRKIQDRIIDLCQKYPGEIPDYVIYELIEQHQRYCSMIRGQRKRLENSEYCVTMDDAKAYLDASVRFFEQAIQRPQIIQGQVDHSDRCDVHNEIKSLQSAHQAPRNFRNEPTVARRVSNKIKNAGGVPESSRYLFVETIVACAIGSGHGPARDAKDLYHRLVQGFSPDEVGIMLSLPKQNQYVGQRIRTIADCKREFRKITRMLHEESVPESLVDEYRKWSA